MKTREKLILIRLPFLLILAALAFYVAGCSERAEVSEPVQQKVHDHEEAEEVHAGDTVIMQDAVLKEFDIETAVAGPGILKTYVYLPGEVVIPPGNLAHVHPRFPGIVKAVYKQTGEFVKEGETLAVIESNQSLTDYTLKSQINGVVTEMHLVKGEMVDDESHGYLIADLTKVWVYLKIYQKDLPFVRAGQEVFISAGPGFPGVSSVIDYISPLIDEGTRTGRARVVLNNKNYRWKPGLFVTGRIVTARKRVDILIPKTAVEIMDDKPVVFIRREDRFFPVQVRLGMENDETYEVLQGLTAGEQYVSSHAFVLKAELQKNEFGEGDEH